MEIVLAGLEYGELSYSEHVKDEFKEELDKIGDKIKNTHFHNCAKIQRNRLQWWWCQLKMNFYDEFCKTALDS